MNKGKLCTILFLMLFFSITALAANLQISGIVVDKATGEPLQFANVVVKGTSVGAATNLNGEFSFDYDTEDEFIIVVNFMGYKSEERSLSPRGNLTNLRFELDEDVFQGETVVVTGIASERSKQVAEVSVSRIPASQLSVKNTYQEMTQLVAGKVAGVRVEQASGFVGGGIRFNMRSSTGLNGNEQPIVYVDGVRIENTEIQGNANFDSGGQGFSTLADINPDDIESIEFLKGPAGAASYGTSGSNGVVLITTKRGGTLVPGDPKGININYKYVHGYNTPAYTFTLDDFLTYDYVNRVHVNGPINQHSLSANGGTGLMRYFVSVDHRDEEGILIPNTMQRTAMRANMDIFPSEKISINVSSSFSVNRLQRPNNDNNIFGWYGMLMLNNVPYFWTDSTAIASLENVSRQNRFIGSVQMSYTPIKNLEVRGSVGIDRGNINYRQYYPPGMGYLFYPDGARQLLQRTNNQITMSANARYTFSPMDNMDITSIVGLQVFDRKVDNFWIIRETFLTGLIKNIGAGEDFSGGDEVFLHTREAGVFTDHSISLYDQYFFSLALRQDYASTIGAEAPSIFYPRASLAVRMDKYDFFPSVFNLFKLRVAYGETGQLPGADDSIPLLWQAGVSGFGVGAIIDEIGNAELEPERVTEIEAGVDLEFLNNYSLEFTYYNQKAINSIIGFANPPSSGLTNGVQPFNIGESRGWGIETLFRAIPIRKRNFELDISIVNTYATNEVVDLGGAQPIYADWNTNVVKEGLKKHEFYMPVPDPDAPALFNPDGTYAGVNIDEGERTALGNPIPDYTGSFSLNLRLFRNLNIYALAEWATNLYVFNKTKQYAIFFGATPNVYEARVIQEQLGLADYDDVDETPLTPGTDEYIAVANQYALMDTDYDGNFVEPGDWFRVREVSVSYNLTSLIDKIYSGLFTDFTVGFSGRNLYLWTKYSGPDPEVNWAGARDADRGHDFLTQYTPRIYSFFVRLGL